MNTTLVFTVTCFDHDYGLQFSYIIPRVRLENLHAWAPSENASWSVPFRVSVYSFNLNELLTRLNLSGILAFRCHNSTAPVYLTKLQTNQTTSSSSDMCVWSQKFVLTAFCSLLRNGPSAQVWRNSTWKSTLWFLTDCKLKGSIFHVNDAGLIHINQFICRRMESLIQPFYPASTASKAHSTLQETLHCCLVTLVVFSFNTCRTPPTDDIIS